MGRPNPVFYTLAPGPSVEAAKEVWIGIQQLLGLANVSRLHPASMPPGFPDAIQSAFTALRDGHDVVLSKDWTPNAVKVFTNLQNKLASNAPGRRYLKACGHCGFWFLADHKRRRNCDAVACQRKLGAMRKAKWDQKDKAIDRYWMKVAAGTR